MRMPFIKIAVAATLAITTFTAPSYALTRQQVSVEFDPTPDDGFNNDETRADDSIDDRNGPIDRALLARIQDPGGRFLSQGSVGEFGNLGLFGSTSLVGELNTQIFIESDAFQNISGRAQEAELRFIIDGGRFVMIGGEGSLIDFSLTIRKDFDVVYQSAFEYRSLSDPNFGFQNNLSTFGTDLDIQTNSRSEIEIPLNFETASLGLIQPNEQFTISYQLDITMTPVGFAEVMSFEFSDPFAVSGFQEFPEIAFSDAPQAVPLPATAPLAAAAIGALVLARRRRRR